MMDSPKHEAYENGGTIVNRYARIAIAVLASVGLLTSASACGTSQNGAGSAHGAISVVSSINQWGTLAEQLGGSGVQVTSIINSTNVDAHDYEPTTSDIAKLQKARIVIVNGAGYDSWAVKAAQSAKSQVINANRNCPSRRTASAAQSAKSQVINAAEIGGVKNGGNPHVWFSAAVRKAVAQAITRAYEGTRPDGKADFDKLNQQWRSKEDEVARKITETKRKADGEAYAATESVAEYLAGDLGLKDATPTGYMRATANESEPTPTDIKQFTDMLEAGKVGLLVVNIQEETELTGKIVTAAKSSNIPIVELTEQMPEQYDSLTDWMAALVDAFSQAI